MTRFKQNFKSCRFKNTVEAQTPLIIDRLFCNFKTIQARPAEPNHAHPHDSCNFFPTKKKKPFQNGLNLKVIAEYTSYGEIKVSMYCKTKRTTGSSG